MSHPLIKNMYAPSTKRKGKWLDGIIQIWVTRACDRACFGCTQGSNLRSHPKDDMYITLENFEIACKSLRNYYGVVGMFGGNPALHPQFEQLCEIMRKHISWKHRGLWCNNPLGKGHIMAQTFNPGVSNLNVHMDQKAYDEFKATWPKSRPFGLKEDSRHSPVHGDMKLLIPDEEERWKLISNCDINKHWSAMTAQFRGQMRGWFCEIAGSQSILNQHNPDYPDTGLIVACQCGNTDPFCTCGGKEWWEHPIEHYTEQINKHCHNCMVPLRGYGELACSSDGTETITPDLVDIYIPKTKGRNIKVITKLEELKPQALELMTDYVGNSSR